MRYNDVFLEESHKFFNSTTQYFNRLEYVSKFQDIIYFLLLRPSSFNRYITHYSYFKSFRSDVSNVGPNVAMLASVGNSRTLAAGISAIQTREISHVAIQAGLQALQVMGSLIPQ